MRQIGLAVILAVSLLALAPVATEAQQAGTVPRIGILMGGSFEGSGAFIDAFREGLRTFGYVEGQNAGIEWRYAGGRPERFTELAGELVRLKVDVVVATNNQAVEALQRATRTLPIVMVLGERPVESGYIATLARPGGNITGCASQIGEVLAKRLQLLLEVVPNVASVAVFGDATNPETQPQMIESAIAAKTLRVRVQLVEVGSAREFESAFAGMVRQGAQAALFIGSSMHYVHRSRIGELAQKSRLPSACPLRGFVEAGCLLSYGVSFAAQWQRAAYFVDKILKGTKPGDLPVEQPTKFDLVINLKTAKALGLTIPPSVLLRADQVIE